MVIHTASARRAGSRVALALLIAIALPAVAEADDADGTEAPTVALRWALAARDSADEKPTAITGDTKLTSGSRLKLLVEPGSAGDFYVLLLDSSDELQVLYRQVTQERTKRTYIPPGKQWFELGDKPGRETFFLLASSEPLEELDRLLGEFAAADDAGRAELQPRIIAEIRRQHKLHRRFSRPVEKPVLIGGQTRGSTGIDHLAAQVLAERFYGKTITIDR